MSQEQDNRPRQQDEPGFLEKITGTAQELHDLFRRGQQFLDNFEATAEAAGRALVQGDERARGEWQDKFETGRIKSQETVTKNTEGLMDGPVSEEFVDASRRGLRRLRSFAPFRSYFQAAVRFHLAENLVMRHGLDVSILHGGQRLGMPNVVDDQPRIQSSQPASGDVFQAIEEGTYDVVGFIERFAKGDPEYEGRKRAAHDFYTQLHREGNALGAVDHTTLQLVDAAAREVSINLVAPQDPAQKEAKQQLIAEKVHEFRTGRAKKLLRRY